MQKEAQDGNGKAYVPSEKAKKAILHAYDRMHALASNRSRTYAYFNDRNLVTYVNDSVKRWNGYIPPRGDLTMDWQAQVFNNFTRNVTVTFLSSVALNRPKIKLVATDKKGYEDAMRAHILGKLYEYSQRKENGEWKFFQSALEAVTKGTCVVYEGYRKIKRAVREVSSYDAATGEVTYKDKEIVDFDDCYREVVPLEDFFVANVWQPDMQMQPDVIWKSMMRFAVAREEFSKYKNWGYVRGGACTSIVMDTPYYSDELSPDLEADQVEVLRYYNRFTDTHIIVANGVLLYDGPIPFAHKRLPFANAIYEPFGVNFFYGKSLPDKVANDQDVINTLWNMMLDQSYLSIFKPVITDDPDAEEDQVLVPGLVMKVNNKEQYRVLDELRGPESSHFNMLQFAQRFAQDNSGSIVGGAMAQTSHGGKVTARQAMMTQEQARQTLGLSAKMLEVMERDAAELRCKNLLQFTTKTDKAEKITGEKDPMRMFTKVLRVDNTELSDGTHGTALVRFSKDTSVLPTPESLEVEEEAAAMQGANIEIHAVTPDYIRNMEFDVQVVPESSYMQNKQLEKGLAMEFIEVATQNPMIAPLMNPLELAREFVAVNDRDPTRFLRPEGPPMAPGMMPGAPGQPQAPGQQPQAPAQAPRGASGKAPPLSTQMNGSAKGKPMGDLMRQLM